MDSNSRWSHYLRLSFLLFDSALGCLFLWSNSLLYSVRFRGLQLVLFINNFFKIKLCDAHANTLDQIWVFASIAIIGMTSFDVQRCVQRWVCVKYIIIIPSHHIITIIYMHLFDYLSKFSCKSTEQTNAGLSTGNVGVLGD